MVRIIEAAKSNRSTCKTCELFIEKDTLRIGAEATMYTAWHHAKCYMTSQMPRSALQLTDLHGHTRLSPKHLDEALTLFGEYWDKIHRIPLPVKSLQLLTKTQIRKELQKRHLLRKCRQCKEKNELIAHLLAIYQPNLPAYRYQQKHVQDVIIMFINQHSKQHKNINIPPELVQLIINFTPIT